MSLAEKKLCRTCESYDEAPATFVSLQANIGRPGITLASALMACVPVEVTENDGLPQQICCKCSSSLQAAYEFQTQCVRVHKKLKKLTLSAETATDNASTIEHSKPIDVKTEPKDIYKHEIEDKHDGDLFVDEDEKIDIEFEAEIEPVDPEIKPIEREIKPEEPEIRDHKDLYRCHRCQKQLRHHGQFIRHVRSHRETTFDCNICKITFDNFPKFEQHINAHRSEMKSYICSVCSKQFLREEQVVRHMAKHRAHFDIKPEVEEKSSKHNKSKVYKCFECGKGYSSKDYMKRHLNGHSEGVLYKCQMCDKSYRKQESLDDHMNKHNGLRPHVCPHCGKSFSQICNLKDHIRTHTGETPYLCSQCGKGFNNGSNLRQHMQRHSGVKPYSCSLCPKTFTTRGQMTTHEGSHTGAHPYVCDVCGSSFTKPNSLKKHKLIHLGVKPHECDVCPRRFSSKDHLKRHYRIHTGEKPYKCVYCERAFTQSNDLIKHTRAHVGQNIYQCKFCPMRFRILSELKLHYPIHYIDGKPPPDPSDKPESLVKTSPFNKTDTKPDIKNITIPAYKLDVPTINISTVSEDLPDTTQLILFKNGPMKIVRVEGNADESGLINETSGLSDDGDK